MRKAIMILLILTLPLTVVFAQDFSFEEMKEAFKDFAEGAANALPMTSTVGLQWSTAYIGQFPHLGFGPSVGFGTIPLFYFRNVFDMFNIDDKALIDQLPPQVPVELLGVPFPAYSIDFRLGGFGLIFKRADLGFKIGFIPYIPGKFDIKELTGMNIDYFMAGGDIRVNLVKQTFWLPHISVGGGYNFIRGGFAIPGLLGSNIHITDFKVPVESSIKTEEITYETSTLELQDPSLAFRWQTHMIDLKAQISKKILLLFTPYIGAGASFALSKAGGGMYTEILKDGKPLTEEEKDELNRLFKEAQQIDKTQQFPDLTADGIIVQSGAPGFMFRAFGGLSINLWVLKTDISLMYNILGKSLGANVNIRLQF